MTQRRKQKYRQTRRPAREQKKSKAATEQVDRNEYNITEQERKKVGNKGSDTRHTGRKKKESEPRDKHAHINTLEEKHTSDTHTHARTQRIQRYMKTRKRKKR